MRRGKNRKTYRKTNRTMIDLVYDILKVSQDKTTKNNIYTLLTTNHDTFNKGFEIAVENKMIIISREKPKDKRIKNYYSISAKGRDYMIKYEKMNTYINQLNMMLQ